jgi:hypothetical protein
MTHPADDYKDMTLSSESSGALLASEEQMPALEDEDVSFVPPEPANQTVMPAPPIAQRGSPAARFERDADMIAAAAPTPEDLHAGASETYETVSQTLRVSTEGLTTAFTQLNWKLFEFARLNAEANFNFVRQIAGVRSMRDLVDVQSAYMRSQYDSLTSQLRELQTLSTEMTAKSTAPLAQPFSRATQLPRSY